MPLSPWQAAHDTDSSLPLSMSDEYAGFIRFIVVQKTIAKIDRNFIGLIISKYQYCAMNRDYVSRQFFPLNVFTIKGTLSLYASDINVHILLP